MVNRYYYSSATSFELHGVRVGFGDFCFVWRCSGSRIFFTVYHPFGAESLLFSEFSLSFSLGERRRGNCRALPWTSGRPIEIDPCPPEICNMNARVWAGQRVILQWEYTSGAGERNSFIWSLVFGNNAVWKSIRYTLAVEYRLDCVSVHCWLFLLAAMFGTPMGGLHLELFDACIGALRDAALSVIIITLLIIVNGRNCSRCPGALVGDISKGIALTVVQYVSLFPLFGGR